MFFTQNQKEKKKCEHGLKNNFKKWQGIQVGREAWTLRPGRDRGCCSERFCVEDGIPRRTPQLGEPLGRSLQGKAVTQALALPACAALPPAEGTRPAAWTHRREVGPEGGLLVAQRQLPGSSSREHPQPGHRPLELQTRPQWESGPSQAGSQQPQARCPVAVL